MSNMMGIFITAVGAAKQKQLSEKQLQRKLQQVSKMQIDDGSVSGCH